MFNSISKPKMLKIPSNTLSLTQNSEKNDWDGKNEIYLSLNVELQVRWWSSPSVFSLENNAQEVRKNRNPKKRRKRVRSRPWMEEISWRIQEMVKAYPFPPSSATMLTGKRRNDGEPSLDRRKRKKSGRKAWRRGREDGSCRRLPWPPPSPEIASRRAGVRWEGRREVGWEGRGRALVARVCEGEGGDYIYVF